jgi:hypothetical protein
MESTKKIKDKIDNILNKNKNDNEKTIVFSPFGKKILGDMELYLSKLDGSTPSRNVSVKFRNDINDKIEQGKEKESLIKFFNKKFKIPGVSTTPFNYFA